MTPGIDQAAETVVTLPWPVSVNAAYRSVNGRTIMSKRYRLWKKQAALELMAQRPKKHVGKVDILVELKAPDKRHRDGDNLLKGILDALKDAGIIEGDDGRYVRQSVPRWVESGPACRVTITGIE